ncbi:MAG: CrcB family protein [Planctomycetota bacterium]
MRNLLLVFLGGGLGSAARYAVALAIARAIPPSETHPRWGSVHLTATLAANAIGCLLIGFAWGRMGIGVREEHRLLLIVGFLGGFTTLSSVGWETVSLIGRSQIGLAAGYILVTVALALLATWLGHTLGHAASPSATQ